MAVPVLETWEFTQGGFATSVALTKPTGVTSGDGLILAVMNDGSGDAPEFADDVTGFTLEGAGGDSATDCHLAIYSRVADGSEGATVTVNAANQEWIAGYYLRISGIDSADFPHVLGTFLEQGSNTTSHAIPSLTTTVDDCLVFYAFAGDGSDMQPVSVSGTGFSEIHEGNAGEVADSNLTASIGSRELSTAGSSGAATVTSSVSDSSVGVQFAIAPVSSVNIPITVPTGPWR